MLYIDKPAVVTAAEQRGTLDLLKQLNDHEGQRLHAGDGELEARSRSYDLAYRMQKTAPDAVDLSKETGATKELYASSIRQLPPPGVCNRAAQSAAPG